MSSLRFDKRAKETYTWYNIPVKEGIVVDRTVGGKFFKIFSSTHDNPNDSWYQECFVGCQWAVFQWVNTSPNSGFYQQKSKWYSKYGNAQRYLMNL